MSRRPRLCVLVFLACAGCNNITGATSSASAPASPSPSVRPSAAPAVPVGDVHADVPGFRGGSARTGVMPGPGPIDDAAVAWTAKLGAPIRTAIVAANGLAFVSTASGTLAAFDLATGGPRWRASVSTSALSTPEVIDDLVVVGTADGLRALDAATGKARWSASADGAVGGAPATAAGLIAFGASSGTVEAVDAATGAKQWSSSAGDPVLSSIAIADGAVVVGTSGGTASGTLVAFDLTSGAQRWRTPVGYAGRVGTPAIESGTVYATTGLDGQGDGIHHVVALDLASGAIEWQYASADGLPVYTPAVGAGQAFVTGEDRTVAKLDATSGAVGWSTTVAGVIEGNPAVAAGAVYATTNGGAALALDATTGRLLWSVPIQGYPAGPTIAGGLLLVGTDLGTLYAIGGRLP